MIEYKAQENAYLDLDGINKSDLNDLLEIGVQIKGKVKAVVAIPRNADKETAFELAKADEKIAQILEGKIMIKEIYVPNKIINFVIK